jgi:recombination protein U
MVLRVAVAVHANRGRALEDLVDLVLAGYEERGIALVRRVPDPWRVVRRGGRVVGAFPARKGLVDYLGVWRGVPVAFDCKETGGVLSFSKLPAHQLEFLERWACQGGLAALLVRFWRRGAVVWVPVGALLEASGGGRRRLTLPECLECGVAVPQRPGVPLDLEAAWRRVLG